MSELKLLIRCPACGAANRVRLVTGKKVRVRCGSCGGLLPVGRRRIFLLLLWQAAKSFLGTQLPLLLIAAVDKTALILGAILRPLRSLWYLVPLKARRRLFWGVVILLLLAYAALEGTLKLTSMLILIVILALAMAVLIIATQGWSALIQIIHHLTGRIFRTCPSCGHRYFGWVKRCPRCGG
ncbi:MAG TPA: hypothetical protein VM123_03690 [archaeon]|nr:hypothetical protein [archaeon]